MQKKESVGAILGRPQILQRKICRRQAKKQDYFPSENPKFCEFRRASKACPYDFYGVPAQNEKSPEQMTSQLRALSEKKREVRK